MAEFRKIKTYKMIGSGLKKASFKAVSLTIAICGPCRLFTGAVIIKEV